MYCNINEYYNRVTYQIDLRTSKVHENKNKKMREDGVMTPYT